MARRAVPKYNIEYVFKFKKGERTQYVTLTYEGINDKGRYEFYNVKAKSFTSMPIARFSYLHRFNLAEERQIKRVGISNVPAHLIEDDTLINYSEEEQKLKKALYLMKGLTEEQKEKVSAAIGRDYSLFITDFERFIKDDDDGASGHVLSEWFKAQACLGLKVRAL